MYAIKNFIVIIVISKEFLAVSYCYFLNTIQSHVQTKILPQKLENQHRNFIGVHRM